MEKHLKKRYLEVGNSGLGCELVYVTHASILFTASQSHVHMPKTESYS